ncbi:hypothetical protein HDV00_001006, partial [Rhizophlyctis rosea]
GKKEGGLDGVEGAANGEGGATESTTTTTTNGTSATSPTSPIAPVRTEEDKAETRRLAKRLFLSSSAITGLDAVQKVVGTRNTVMGMTRLFNMLQERELNRVLVVGVLEGVLRGVVM